MNKGLFSTKNLVKMAVLSAVATVVMIFEIPLWFAPSFYKIDLSEVVVLIGAFSLGPIAGVVIELLKVLLNLLFNGTQTAGVGELANFIIGCAFVLPASLIYKHNKTFKNALFGMIIGTLCMTIIGSALNYWLLLPAYAAAFTKGNVQIFIDMGRALNPMIDNLLSFVVFATAPFNLLKGIISSVVVLILYKRVSSILRK